MFKKSFIKNTIKKKIMLVLISLSLFSFILLLPNISFADNIGTATFSGIEDQIFAVVGLQNNIYLPNIIVSINRVASVKAQFDSLYLGLEFHPRFPTLFFNCAAGIPIANVVINLSISDLTITLTKVGVSSVELKDNILSIGLKFSQIQWETTDDVKGWDLERNAQLELGEE